MNSIVFDGKKVMPTKVVCIGRNYVEHIKELNNEIPSSMVIFIKANSAIGDTLFAENGEALHYEGELCFIVKEKKIAGVGFGLDLTKRDLQSKLKSKGLPWERAKSFDGAALFSHFVSFDQDLDELSLELSIDGEVVQSGNVSMMMYKPNEILDEINTFTSLEDYDIIMSGTPKGVGKVAKDSKYVASVAYKNEVLLHHSWIAQ